MNYCELSNTSSASCSGHPLCLPSKGANIKSYVLPDYVFTLKERSGSSSVAFDTQSDNKVGNKKQEVELEGARDLHRLDSLETVVHIHREIQQQDFIHPRSHPILETGGFVCYVPGKNNFLGIIMEASPRGPKQSPRPGPRGSECQGHAVWGAWARGGKATGACRRYLVK